MKTISCLLTATIMLLLISGCASKPDSDIFFTCKNFRPDNKTMFGVSYPDDFYELNRNRFSRSNDSFYLIYYNKYNSAGCHIRITGPDDVCCMDGRSFFVPQGLYYFIRISIGEYLRYWGPGRYEVKLYRNGTVAKTLEFYLEKDTHSTRSTEIGDGIAAKFPGTDVFFVCRSFIQNETVIYPDSFIGWRDNHFSVKDQTLCLVYFSKFRSGSYYAKVLDPKGQLCNQQNPAFVEKNDYYFIRFDKLSELVEQHGSGKYEAKLYYKDSVIKTLEFYLKK